MQGRTILRVALIQQDRRQVAPSSSATRGAVIFGSLIMVLLSFNLPGNRSPNFPNSI